MKLALALAGRNIVAFLSLIFIKNVYPRNFSTVIVFEKKVLF